MVLRPAKLSCFFSPSNLRERVLEKSDLQKRYCVTCSDLLLLFKITIRWLSQLVLFAGQGVIPTPSAVPMETSSKKGRPPKNKNNPAGLGDLTEDGVYT
jgi:hypothetical protein